MRRVTPMMRIWKHLTAAPTREAATLGKATTTLSDEAGHQSDRRILDLVNTLYRALLDRDPDPAGFAHYAAGVAHRDSSVREIALLLLKSAEFGKTNEDWLSQLPCVINFNEEWRMSTRRYYDAVAKSGVSSDQIAQMYDEAGLTENEYTTLHSKRFYELFAYLAASIGQCSGVAELLEIGTSAHSTPFYRKFLDCRYDTICRPARSGGPTLQWAVEAGSRTHWEIDLNYPERYPIAIEQVPRSHYDAVICTEVIEHLTRAPRDLIKFALSTTKEDGFLYLTTPNFLRPSSISGIYAGVSPVADFQDYNNNFHAHHHFREYTARELINEVAEAGGVTQDVIFSNCWDSGRYTSEDEIMFRSNIVMVISRSL